MLRYGMLISMASVLAFGGCKHGLESSPSNTTGVPATQYTQSMTTDNQRTESPVSAQVKPMSADDPVEVRVSCRQVGPGDKVVVTIAFDVEAGYELQSFQSKPPKQPTRVEIRQPSGWVLEGELQIPETKRSRIPGNGSIYSGQFECQQALSFSSEVDLATEQMFECLVAYQACDERKCLRPLQAVFKLPIKINK
jgi:hypothetical protein